MLQEKPDFANSMVQCTFPEALYKVDVNLSTDKELEKVFLNFQVYMSKGIIFLLSDITLLRDEVLEHLLASIFGGEV
jgi:hypothetical protein